MMSTVKLLSIFARCLQNQLLGKAVPVFPPLPTGAALVMGHREGPLLVLF